MKKWVLTFSCFFLLFSCTNGDSSDCGCGAIIAYYAFLNQTIVDASGNSFNVSEVRLEDSTLGIKGNFVFQNLLSTAMFISPDGDDENPAWPHDFKYFLDLETTNQKNDSSLSDENITLSGEWTLCFPVDEFFFTEMESFFYEDSSQEKTLYAYFAIKDHPPYKTLFYIPFSEIIVVQ